MVALTQEPDNNGAYPPVHYHCRAAVADFAALVDVLQAEAGDLPRLGHPEAFEFEMLKEMARNSRRPRTSTIHLGTATFLTPSTTTLPRKSLIRDVATLWSGKRDLSH